MQTARISEKTRCPDRIYMQAPLAEHTNSVGHKTLLFFQVFFPTYPVPLALSPLPLFYLRAGSRKQEAKVVQTARNLKICRCPDRIYMQAPLAQHISSVGHRSLFLYQPLFSTYPLPCALSPLPLKSSRTCPPYPNLHRKPDVRGI